MRRYLLAGLFLSTSIGVGFSQNLFKDQTPFEASMRISISEIKENTRDSAYTLESLRFKQSNGEMDSIQIGVRGRGNFRFQECHFPPLKIKIKKKEAKDTPFEGNEKVKLVMPCKVQSGNNELIIKELLCYKLYEVASERFFQTRQLNLQYEEVRKRKTISNDFTAFVIEDDEDVAKRLGAKLIENPVHSMALSDTIAILNDFFQFMIGNVDYSLGSQHNAKVFFNTKHGHFPVVYDFDMAGIVNPPYWTVPSRNGQPVTQGTATDRLFLGFCRSEAVYNWVRNDYLKKEAAIMEVINQYQNDLSPAEVKRINSFLEDFFIILKDDGKFKRQIMDSCRN